MEKDQNISRMIRESGLEKAPDHFTGKVMAAIGVENVKSAYKPLIGKTGKFMILLFTTGIVVLTLFSAEPGGRFLELSGRLSGIQWKVPWIGINFDFIAKIDVSAWLISTVVALFLLVLSDFLLRRKEGMVN